MKAKQRADEKKMRKIDRQKRQITTRADQEKAINIKQIRKKMGDSKQ